MPTKSTPIKEKKVPHVVVDRVRNAAKGSKAKAKTKTPLPKRRKATKAKTKESSVSTVGHAVTKPRKVKLTVLETPATPPPVIHRVRKTFHRKFIARVAVGIASFLLLCAISGTAFFVMKGKEIVYTQIEEPVAVTTVPEEEVVLTNQFPLGVDPLRKEIVENPSVESYFEEHVAINGTSGGIKVSWLGKVMGKLALMNWYQNLAAVSSRILVIESGERKEQVAEHFTKILGWTALEKAQFLSAIESAEPELSDGKFFPGTYTVVRGAKPDVVIPLVTDRFASEVLSRYGEGVESVVPLNDALIIASLLEREAYDFEDMRLIAGVIWNRLFIDMNLQIDATLQYAKGSKPTEPWWPKVKPSDKYISSLYNTYKNSGLPPAPIANPSLDSIIAALNPRKTDCMYYFHDKHAEFHCSVTYEEHVSLLKKFYGRGK